MTEINNTNAQLFVPIRTESVRDILIKKIRSSREGITRSTQVQIMEGEDFIPVPSLESEDIDIVKEILYEISEKIAQAQEQEQEQAQEQAATDDSDSYSEVDFQHFCNETAELEEECHRIICKQVFSFPEGTNFGECSICLDIVETVANYTTTRCGHSFHTSCFLKAIETGTEGTCPNCRAIVVVKESDDDDSEWTTIDDDDDDSDAESEAIESESDSDEDEDESESPVTLEQAANKLQEMGYTAADILSFYLGRTIRSENSERYTQDFFVKINDDLNGILSGSIAL